jgi:hypothetical protein
LQSAFSFAIIYMPAIWGQLTRLIKGDDTYGYF